MSVSDAERRREMAQAKAKRQMLVRGLAIYTHKGRIKVPYASSASLTPLHPFDTQSGPTEVIFNERRNIL